MSYVFVVEKHESAVGNCYLTFEDVLLVGLEYLTRFDFRALYLGRNTCIAEVAEVRRAILYPV